MTLTEFLLARIAEDEAVAEPGLDYLSGGTLSVLPGACHPSRVLAECAAKRKIVSLANWEGAKDSIRDRIFGPSADMSFQKGIEVAMRSLAAVYADHPDYDETWRL